MNSKEFLDSEIKAMEADIWARGEPDCFVVFKICPAHKTLESPPLAIYGKRAGLYEKFPALKIDAPWAVTIALWWFDDKETK